MQPFKTVHLISHTHWDRAWYLSEAAYRVRLIQFFERLFVYLDQNPKATFLLDAQTSIIDDYLTVFPKNASKICSFVKSKQLFIGPWFTLPDLFLSPPEALIRNLEIGISKSIEWGVQSNFQFSGYVPDPFGHPSQMPQILNGFNIHSYYFMRGANNFISQNPIFEWKSISGNALQAVYLKEGYLGASALGYKNQWGFYKNETPQFEEAQRLYTQVSENQFQWNDSPVLLLNGCDHMPVQEDIGETLNKMNLNWEYSSLEMFDQETRKRIQLEGKTLEAYTGPLISGGTHPVLQNVYSSRIELKQLSQKVNAQLLITEKLLLCVKKVGDQNPYSAILNNLWKDYLKCLAHDNIGGCSIDLVHQEDELLLNRTIEALKEVQNSIFQDIQLLLSTEKKKELITNGFVFNPHPFEVEHSFTQWVFIENQEGEFAKHSISPIPVGSFIKVKLKPLHEREFIVQTQAKVLEFIGHDVTSRFLETLWGAKVLLEFKFKLPAFSIQQLEFNFHSSFSPSLLPQQLNQGFQTIKDNFDLSLIDDVGDTYSWSAPKIKRQFKKSVRWLSETQAQFTWIIQEDYTDAPRVQERELYSLGSPIIQEVNVELIQKNNNAIEFKINYLNSVRNSKLVWIYKTADNHTPWFVEHPFILENVDSLQKNQEEDVQIPQAQKYPGEKNYPIFFQNRFSYSKNVWITTKGIHEGNTEVTNAERTVSFTLNRSVNRLSVAEGSIRSCQAGPSIVVEGAQGLKSKSAFIQVTLLNPAFPLGEAFKATLLYHQEPIFYQISHRSQNLKIQPPDYAAQSAPFFRIEQALSLNEWIELQSSRQKNNQTIELRFVNLSQSHQVGYYLIDLKGTIESCFLTNFLGEKITPLELKQSTIELKFLPGEIKTVLLEIN